MRLAKSPLSSVPAGTPFPQGAGAWVPGSGRSPAGDVARGDTRWWDPGATDLAGTGPGPPWWPITPSGALGFPHPAQQLLPAHPRAPGHTPPSGLVPYHLVLPGPRPSSLLGPLRKNSGTCCWPGICPLPPKGPHSQVHGCGQILGSVWSPQGLAQALELGRWPPVSPSQASQLPGPRCHPLPTK